MYGSFCHDEFWNLNATWFTTIPDFTLCFQGLILSLMPCLCFCIAAIISLWYILRYRTSAPLPWTLLCITKVGICVVLLVISLSSFGLDVHGKYSEGDVPEVAIFSSCARSITFTIVLITLLKHRTYGVKSSTLLSVFWLCYSFCGTIIYRSSFLRFLQQVSPPISTEMFVLQMIYYPLVYAELFLSFFSDAKDYNILEKRSPIDEEPFFSYITFLWFNKIIYQGTKTHVTTEDLLALSYRQKANYLWKKFQAVYKFKSITTENSLPSSERAEITKPKPQSLAWALTRALWPWIVCASVLEITFDFMKFVTPMILDLIINFISNDEYLWRGYLYCGAILVSNVMIRFLYNNYIFLAICFGSQVKSALTGAVFRKCLQISSSTRRNYTSGALTNLISVDVERVVQFALYFTVLFGAPIKILLTIVFLWQYLGPSCLAGVVVIILLIPISLVVSRISEKLSHKQMGLKDNRLKYMNEVLSGIKILKLYAWEIPFMHKISETRIKEVSLIRSSQMCYVATSLVFSCAPVLVAVATFTTYLLVDESHVLDPSTAFVSINLMSMLKFSLFEIPDAISELIQTNISLGRISKFFVTEEYDADVVGENPKKGEVLSINEATFTWSRNSEPTLKNVDLHVRKGKLVAVIGSVGSGKSSLLSAVLGEMYKTSGSVDLKGSVAYVPQQAWILNRTVKENILLVRPMQESSYKEILEACCLKPDLEILPGGDETEIGEKGVNISGGQKQRVSLARAVFQDSDVYLLDDPLSAVDAHVRKDLFENVIGNTGLLKRKTRILVTHDISILPQVDVVVNMKDGKVEEIGTYSELMRQRGYFAQFIQEHTNPEKTEELEQDNIKLESVLTRMVSRDSQISRFSLERTVSTDSGLMKSVLYNDDFGHGGKLVEDEKMEIGEVKRGVFLNYLKHAGPFYFLSALLGIVAFNAFEMASNIWLSKWSADSTNLNQTDAAELRTLRIAVYGGLGAGQVFFSAVGTTMLILAATRASALYHKQMLQGVMRSPMSFFDSTPFGRIMNRFSSDMDIIDVQIVYEIDGWLFCLLATLATFIVIGMNTPMFLAALIPIIVCYYCFQKLYLNTSRQLKRLETTTRSPIYSHFLETVQGISSIKAYKVEKEFMKKMESNIDTHILCYFNGIACNRWLSFWLDLLGNLIVLVAILLAIQNRGVLSAAVVGLTVTYALSVTDALIWLVRCNTELENKSVSVERLEEYCKLTPEAPWNDPTKDPPPEWPGDGSIFFEGYSTRYREGLDLVLKQINLQLCSNEKIGIVGRTGAGKSSVTLALFRIIESAEGKIVIDNVDISEIGLHALRSKLTIIPQDPVLFTGSLRLNLDPNNEYSDEALWKSLEQAHLKNFVSTLSEGLNYDLSEGGENLSVGQRQLICLARALIKKTKILVLDEATAAVDLDTDRLIQNSIRTEFAKHTVITIAHRLNTIMDYDKIVVMDLGTIVEVGNPAALLQDSESKFYHMAKDAGLI